jgi:hypothetical protein
LILIIKKFPKKNILKLKLQLAQQMVASIKALNIVNNVTPIFPYQDYIVYLPITLGVCSFVLLGYGLVPESYRTNHPHNMYEEFIRDGLERGILDRRNNEGIELPVINRNNNTNQIEQPTIPQTNTSTHINNTGQKIKNLSRSSQDNHNSNNALENRNQLNIEMDITEVIIGSTSMRNEVLKNTNKSTIVEEINKRRVSSDKFKNLILLMI